MKVEHEVSAGGLVVRGEEVLLISVRQGRRWQLPKGHVEAGETRREAARREVREETGVWGRVRAPLPDVEYWYTERGTRRIHKTVHYYLLAYESGDEGDFDPGEVSGAGWFPWDEAIRRLTFANERRVVAVAREKLAAGDVSKGGEEAGEAAGSGCAAGEPAGKRGEKAVEKAVEAAGR